MSSFSNIFTGKILSLVNIVGSNRRHLNVASMGLNRKVGAKLAQIQENIPFFNSSCSMLRDLS